jgi:hypothetical protein
MNITIVDPITDTHWHANFNALFIKVFTIINKSDNIDVALESNQLEQAIVNTVVSQENINIIKLPKINNNRLQRSLYIFKKLTYLVKAKKTDLLVFLASDNLVIPIYIYLFSKIFKKTKIIIFMHNNLESIKQSSFKQYLWRRILNRNIHGIFLSKYVYNYSKNYLHHNTLLLPHPSYYDLFNIHIDRVHKYDFLILGRHSESFGDNDFTKQFLDSCSKYSNRQINIIIGSNSTMSTKNNNIKINTYTFPISTERYWELLYSSKFLIIPPESGLRLTASGVHLDAITACLPTIAPKIGTFYENTPKSCNHLLYDEDIERTIKYALNLNVETYHLIVKDLKLKSNSLNINSTVTRVEKLLNNIGVE